MYGKHTEVHKRTGSSNEWTEHPKGTIVDILPDDKMPRDKFGNVADIIVDPKSTISRLNIGRLYEMYTKASIVKVSAMIKHEVSKISKKLDLDELKDDDIYNIYDIIIEYLTIYDNEYTKASIAAKQEKDLDAMLSVISEAITDKLRVYLPLDNTKRKYEIVNDILVSNFAPVNDKIYMDASMTTETVDNMFVTPLYMFMLSKIADSTLASASSKVNHFGLPVVANKTDKFDFPHKNSPGRFLGETELRILSAYTDPKFVAEYRDRNANVNTHREVYKNLLSADKPTNVETLVDRSEHPYGRDRALEILISLWNSAGFTLEHVEDEHPDYEYVGEADDEAIGAGELVSMSDIDIENEDEN